MSSMQSDSLLEGNGSEKTQLLPTIADSAPTPSGIPSLEGGAAFDQIGSSVPQTQESQHLSKDSKSESFSATVKNNKKGSGSHRKTGRKAKKKSRQTRLCQKKAKERQ